jgi:hypothetical protein
MFSVICLSISALTSGAVVLTISVIFHLPPCYVQGGRRGTCQSVPISIEQTMVTIKVDILMIIGVLAVYLALQLWILPKMGIST